MKKSANGTKTTRQAGTVAAQDIYTALFDRIVAGELADGSHLKELALAKEFGLSRTPVREALRQLVQDGLVEFLPRQGARVVAFTVDDIEDVYDIRLSLELLAIDIAGHGLRLQFLKDIRDRIAMNGCRPNGDDLARTDAELHGYLVQATGRRYLIAMYEQTGRLMERFRFFGFRDSEVVQRATEEHVKFIDALLVRDVEEAKDVLRQHIKSSKLSVLAMLKVK